MKRYGVRVLAQIPQSGLFSALSTQRRPCPLSTTKFHHDTKSNPTELLHALNFQSIWYSFTLQQSTQFPYTPAGMPQNQDGRDFRKKNISICIRKVKFTYKFLHQSTATKTCAICIRLLGIGRAMYYRQKKSSDVIRFISMRWFN